MDEMLTITSEEYVRIAAALRNARDIDLSYYQPVVTRHRFTKFAQEHGFSKASMLIERIQTDKLFADMMISQIKVSTTEMFRDPQTWLEVEAILKERLSQESLIKIWIPDICGDDELSSMLVILSRCNMLHKSMVYATSEFQSCIAGAQKGEIDSKKYEASEGNLKRMMPEESLQNYVSPSDKWYILSRGLLSKAIFIKQSVLSDPPPDKGFNLILFRNRALYYTGKAKKRLIETLAGSLLPGGYLLLGIGENIGGADQEAQFVQASKTENIFRKK